MIHITDEFLAEVGLEDMSAADKQAFAMHVYESLTKRVGDRLSEGLTNQQLAEFEHISDATAAMQWFERHSPNYKAVVAEEAEKLKQEIIVNKDQIIDED